MSALSPDSRAESLAALAADRLDVLIVGGGITGVGAALDAAARGLRVGLVEARDFAAGASSKSSKVIHGGLRYLEMGDVGLVREALRERELLLTRLAPHLVNPVPFLWPLRGRMWERAYLGAGLLLYDTLGGARSVPRHRHLSRTRVGAEFPALRRDGVVGAVQFYDAAEDDARMVAMVARTAAAHGAHLVTRARVLTLRRDGRRVTGAEVVDSESGDTVSVSARHVAVAVGAWTDEVRGGLGTRFSTRMVPSKGVHIVVARDRIPLSTGLLARTEKSVLFVVPSPGGWLIGDTDTPWPYGPDLPVASGADVDYLLAKVNALLADPLTRDDVRGVFAGIRPLVGPAEAGSGGDTTRLSRNHVIDTSVPGLTTIAGGKYTTYRVMAADLIDAAVRDFGGGRVPPSGTSRIPIFGGSRPAELAALVDDDPSLAEPLPGGEGHVAAEVVHACLFEGALHLEDVLERRTRLAIMSPDRGLEAAPAAAALMASRLDWTAEQVDAEVEAWRRRVAAERAGEAQPDDERALRAYRAALAGDPAEVASR